MSEGLIEHFPVDSIQPGSRLGEGIGGVRVRGVHENGNSWDPWDWE